MPVWIPEWLFSWIPGATSAGMVSIQMAMHVAAGSIGAFLAFPLAIGARKGSPWHRLAGRVFVGAFVVICFTGYLLDWDEIRALQVFRAWASPNLLPSIYAPGEPLPLRQLIVAGTAAINTFALYLALSGWRVWARRQAVASQQPQRLDQVLAVAELVACAVFMLAFWRLIPDLGLNPWLRLAIPLIAALPVIDAGNDLIQATRGLAPAQWWLQHLRKLAMAEAGLLAAVALRCTPRPYVILGMAASLLVIAIPTLLMVRHQLRNP